ncbi:MAG: UDP-4-amino-4,6-dideoxy-N-acetyl-beta-L-altrosamine N-acetyltransferase [Gemmatimonadota bacterium]|nr:UDP-4-amino-4,6-dideoxy-N-acetyl-beta-L-altrosamine N-acetyltransferase [Gemmatimonadota bacterium]
MLRFAKVREQHLELILRWRRQPAVTSVMMTDVDLDMEKQRRWFERISSDQSVRYWIIMLHDKPLGVINLAEINLQHRRCSAGYYIGELDFKQLGAVIPPYLYNHVFLDLRLNKIYGEVVSSNKAVLRMHTLHGYRQVGTFYKHIVKNGELLDIVAVELLAETWLAQPKYRRYVAEFEA